MYNINYYSFNDKINRYNGRGICSVFFLLPLGKGVMEGMSQSPFHQRKSEKNIVGS